MDASEGRLHSKRKLAVWLAGLEGGTVGVLWMLAWLGVSSVWQQRSFWTAENLMATAFDRNSQLAPLFTWETCAGLALYVLIYSMLGALFASVVRDRAPRGRILLLAVAFSLAWYYFSFRLLFKLILPLVALLHMERVTLVGHLLYGAMLGRYPLYTQRLMSAGPLESAAPAIHPSAESIAPPSTDPPPEAPPA